MTIKKVVTNFLTTFLIFSIIIIAQKQNKYKTVFYSIFMIFNIRGDFKWIIIFIYQLLTIRKKKK